MQPESFLLLYEPLATKGRDNIIYLDESGDLGFIKATTIDKIRVSA